MPNSTGAGLTPFGIYVDDVRRTDSGSSPDTVDVAWNLTYTGLDPLIREDIDILQDGTTDWSHVSRSTSPAAQPGIRRPWTSPAFPRGPGTVRITAQADDAGEDTGTTQFVIQGAVGTPKIKIS